MSKTISYKTNLKCNGCIAAVTPFFDKTEGIKKWTVDLENPDRVLTVELDGTDSERVKSLVKEAGYQAEEL